MNHLSATSRRDFLISVSSAAAILALPKLGEFRYVSDTVLQRGFAPHPAPRWLPTRANRRLAYGLAGLRDIVDGIIAQRRGRPWSEKAPDLIGLLLNARDAENSEDRMSDEEVADQGPDLPARGPRHHRIHPGLPARRIGSGPGVAADRAR